MNPISWVATIYAIGFVVFTIKALTLGTTTRRSIIVGLCWPYIVGKFIATT